MGAVHLSAGIQDAAVNVIDAWEKCEAAQADTSSDGRAALRNLLQCAALFVGEVIVESVGEAIRSNYFDIRS